MSVQVRSKRVEGFRRRREAGHGRPSERTDQASQAPEQATRSPLPRSVSDERHPVRSEGTCSGKPLTNDRALYKCQCGFVFEAPVTTSVGCPHCSTTQAW
jgi:hypothetical protein